MENVYEELDEAKAEIEKLREQFRLKSELAENLKRAHNDQLAKNKEASVKLEKLVHELNEKDDSISTSNHLIEELKSNLTAKESIIRSISSAHDKLRVDCNEKLRKFDEENKALALAFDEANAKNEEQEKQIRALKQEIEGVRRSVNISERKIFSDNENKVKNSKELERREDVFHELEVEKGKFEEQLKWKKEQFAHLEEAHKNLRDEFKKKEKEWEKEKGTLLDEISSLQTNLESQTRISKDLGQRLEMCNNALAHAESKRKLLEAQLSESRTSFDSICAEYEEAKSNFEALTDRRDREIATLRSSLGAKEVIYKEMEYQFRKLGQDNKELLLSLKEIREDRIQEAGKFSSSSKFQNKLKSLKQAHKGCLADLKTKESEIEKLTKELNSCKLEMENKDFYLNELKVELEKLELLNQETSLMLLVLKSEFSEARLRLSNNHEFLDSKNKELEKNITNLVEKLEIKKAALDLVQKDLEEERAKVVLLSEKVQSLEALQLPLQKEELFEKAALDLVQKELEEERAKFVLLSEKVQSLEALQLPIQKELYQKACEASEVEFELQIWKSIAEQLELNANQNLQMRKQVEASLLAQMEVEVNLKQENESLAHLLEEKEKRIDGLLQQQQLVERNERANMEEISEASMTEQQAMEIQVDLQKSYEFEKETLHQLVEEKDQRIYDLQQLVASLEQEFESSMSSFSSKLSQMQEEINLFRESWETIKEDGILKEMEIQEKNVMIAELEKDVGNLIQKMEQHEKNSEKKIHQEINKKVNEDSMRFSEENRSLVNSMSLLSERVKDLSMEDMELVENLGKIVKNIEIDGIDDEHDPVKENLMMSFLSSSTTKKADAVHDERSPLRTLNN